MARGLALLAIAVVVAACSDHDLELGSASSDTVQQGQLVKPTEVGALDQLVNDINGFDSAGAFEDHARRYLDDVDTRFDQVYCPLNDVVEQNTRVVTRSREGQVLRKLVLTWASTRGKTFVTTHEAYHYDDAGSLRVVVVDRETNHTNDEGFRKNIENRNAEIARAIADMSHATEAERVAIAQKGHELRDPTTITQHRVYYRPDGTPFYETRRDGLEAARANDYPDIPQTPPTLYGESHPANVTALPYLLALSPSPRYSARALPETVVTPKQLSIQTELIAASLASGELSLLSRPACR